MKKTKRLALCAVLSALGVTILWIGSVLDFLDLTVACVASVISIFAVIELGGKAPWGIYAVTGLLSLILLPVKFIAIEYIVFAGIYPMLKYQFERRIRRTFLLWCVKLAYACAMLTVMYFASKVLLAEEVYTPLLLALSAVLGIAAFLLFDLVLTRLISIYFYRLRARLRVERFLK